MSVSLLPRGANFVRTAIALARAEQGDYLHAAQLASKAWGEQSVPTRVLRAAVTSGSLTPGADWGEELGLWTQAQQEFIALVRERSLLGRMANLRRVPFKTKVTAQAESAAAQWVAAGKPKPATAIEWSEPVTLEPLKVAALVVITQELSRLADPTAEQLIRADLVGGLVKLIDTTFISPTWVATPNESPASVTGGAMALSSSGNPAQDIAALVEAAGDDLDLTTCYLVCHPLTAARLALWRDAAGAVYFPAAGVRGGDVVGIPLLTSTACGLTSSPKEGPLVLLDAQGIVVAEGAASVRVSTQADVQLDTDPNTGANAQVSLWQSNLIGILAEQDVNWHTARTPVYVADASYALV